MKTIFALVLAAALSSCTMVAKFVAEEPKVELKSVGFTKLSLSEVKLNFEAEVENPNKFELGLDRMEYDVLLSESRIGSGTFTEGFKVAAESRGVLKVPFSLDTGAALKVAQKYFSSGAKLNLRVQGVADFSTPIGKFTKEFSAEKPLEKSR